MQPTPASHHGDASITIVTNSPQNSDNPERQHPGTHGDMDHNKDNTKTGVDNSNNLMPSSPSVSGVKRCISSPPPSTVSNIELNLTLDTHDDTENIINFEEFPPMTTTQSTNKKSKKLKKADKNTEINFEDARHSIEENRQKYPISFNNMVKLIDLSSKTKNFTKLVEEFTNDKEGLKMMLCDTKKALTDRRTKLKITKLLKRQWDTTDSVLLTEDSSDN